VPEQKPNRATILIVLAAVVLLAPLLGVYAFSPLMFVWGIEPYQLAVAVGVMLAEALLGPDEFAKVVALAAARGGLVSLVGNLRSLPRL
jgi:hypothetical protein